jgi:hypothetical protein
LIVIIKDEIYLIDLCDPWCEREAQMVDAIGERRPSIRNTVGIGVIFLLSGLVLDYFFTRQNVGLRVELSLTIVAFFVTVTGVILSIAGGTGLQFQRAISLSMPGKPAVFCSVERRGMFLADYNLMSIYGVYR